jgi:predicted GIY-YIG superfamily endonuclease
MDSGSALLRSLSGMMGEGMWLYIMASGWNGTLYIGVTNSLSRRIAEHREGRAPNSSASMA